MFSCDSILLIYSQNEKCYRQICRANIRFIFIYLYLYSIIFTKVVPLMRQCGTIRYRRTGHTYDNIIWRMHFACRITQAANIDSEYVILISSRLQQQLHNRASIACLFLFSPDYMDSAWKLTKSPSAQTSNPQRPNSKALHMDAVL